MEIIYILVPGSIILALAFLALYVWATRSGQFEDLDTPKWRAIFDEDDNLRTNSSTTNEKSRAEK